MYATDREIEEVVGKFEGCQFAWKSSRDAWHLTVACWYLCTMSPEAALSRMRRPASVYRPSRQAGYHETITLLDGVAEQVLLRRCQRK
jgi:hypothetical protein